MNVVINRGIVTEVFTSQKNGTQYGTIQSAEGTFKVSSPQGGFDLESLPRIEPLEIKMQLKGRVFQGGSQGLEVTSMNVKQLSGKASQ